MLTIYTSYSDWIDWEVKTSYDNDIPIIGVAPWGQERTSKTVTNCSIVDVKWNTESIVRAIRTHAK